MVGSPVLGGIKSLIKKNDCKLKARLVSFPENLGNDDFIKNVSLLNTLYTESKRANGFIKERLK
jgi:hypothetical protein